MVRSEVLTPAQKEHFWKSEDLRIAHEVLIPPFASKTAVVEIDEATRRFLESASDLQRVKPGIRSRFAHIGMNIAVRDLESQVGEFDDQSDSVVVEIENHVPRPIIVREGSPFMRFFYDPASLIIKGQDLQRAVGEGRIKLRGNRGVDWEWATNDIGEISGVFLRIDTDTIKTIPPYPSTPIEIDPTAPKFRQRMDGIYVPAPESDNPFWWIAETSIVMGLDPSIEGILDTRVLNSIDSPPLDSSVGYQTNSQIFDSDRNHRMRVEIVGVTTPNRRANFVKTHFLQNGDY